MFAGDADYGMYQRCCRGNRKEKFVDLGFASKWGRTVDPQSRARFLGGRSCQKRQNPNTYVSTFLRKFRASPHPDLRRRYPRSLVTAPSKNRRPRQPPQPITQQISQDGSRRWSSCRHSRTYCTGPIDVKGRRDAVLDVEMLIVCETVCLLSGLPQEGYDPSVHLPAPVQVSRDRSSKRGRG